MKVLAIAILVATLTSCSPSTQPESSPNTQRVYRNEVRFGLSFEERMTIPAALSVIRSEAQTEADEKYPSYRSREDAIKNDELAEQLIQERTGKLREEKKLTQEQLDQIIAEYQLSLGAPLR